MKYVIKRDKTEVPFNITKIEVAVTAANNSVSEKDRLSNDKLNVVVKNIKQKCDSYARTLNIEEIQDIVEKQLMENGAYEVAQSYIKYRYSKELARKSNATDEQILSLLDCCNEEVKQENSNKNPTIASVQRDYMAGEVSKDITRRLLLPEAVVKAHDEGIIHFHDSDYFAQRMYNCCLVNLEDMLMNGTVISGTMIEKPHSFSTACNIATQIIAQIASSQYGGQSISLTHLVPFVDISRQKIRREVELEYIKLCPHADCSSSETQKKLNAIVESRLRKEIKKGVQIMQYQVVTLMTTNGQAPFITFFMYLGEAKTGQEKADLALIIEEVIKQRTQGVKNEKGVWVSPAFPKLIYVLEEDNISEDSKYWYLTKLAAICTANRMVPDYISEKKMKELKEGYTYPCMGCVDGKEIITYKYMNNLYVESFERMWDRLSDNFEIKHQYSEDNPNLYIDLSGVEIYDTKKGFVNTKRIIRNISDKWLDVHFSNGRRLLCTNDHPFEIIDKGVVKAENLSVGDKLIINQKQVCTERIKFDRNKAQLFGFSAIRKIPSVVFEWDYESKIGFMAGMIDARGYISYMHNDGLVVQIVSADKELALQQMALAQALGMPAKLYYNKYDKNKPNSIRYRVEFTPTKELIAHIVCRKKTNNYVPCTKERYNTTAEVIKITPVEKSDFSYDVTTESEHFEVSGIYSHNCRSFLSVWKNEDGKAKFYGRFNKGVVTINLVDVALSSLNSERSFWEIFNERLELCHIALKERYKRLKGTKSNVAPILWQNGAIARLKPNETIDELLTGGYSTISLGYAGLWECVYALLNRTLLHPEGKVLGKKIMQYMNDKCNEWNQEENLGYSVYGTPLESTTYKFSKCLQRRFGIIEGVTDKNYITNSYHIHVTQDINAFEKLYFESKFQALSPGGCISYIEVPNMKGNINAVLSVIKFIYDNIMYAELNTKSDYCQDCGFDGEIQIIETNNKLVWQCPNCGNTDQTKMNVARRTCGYIGTQYWNQGRTQEIKDRVLHL